MWNIITGINESKTAKHVSCEFKCKFDGRNSHQWLNDNKCWCWFEKSHLCEKDQVWNPATCVFENWK